MISPYPKCLVHPKQCNQPIPLTFFITSKHARGKTFCKVYMVSTNCTLNTSMVLGLVTFKQNLVNIWLKLIRDMCVFSCIRLQRQKGSTYYIKMW